MFIDKIQSNKIILFIIFLGFLSSCLLTISNLNNYDKNIQSQGTNITYHQMIKSDPHRYLSDGFEIKNQLKNGKNFLETGPENYTKYLPARLAALYYYYFDINLFNNSIEKIINPGIHLNYLLIQCFFYFFCLTLLYFSLIKIINKKVSTFIVLFLCFEQTIFQYHGSFWRESIFFSLQILLISLILKKDNSMFNFFFIGLFLGILSLQKEYSIFYIVPVVIYFIFTSNNLKYQKIFILFLSFSAVQLFLGFNNYKRSGNFYIMSADSKVNLHIDLTEKVMKKKYKISQEEFKIIEGKESLKWVINNSIKFDEKKIINIYKPRYMEVRESIIEESDKVKFDNNIRKRTINYFFNYPLDFINFIFKSSIHIILLNPFHIWADNNFISGEYYYTTETHKKLIPYRIIYSLIIYSICFLGFLSLIRKKEYTILLYLIFSALYFYVLVSWHGNTRYFLPVLIYLSFFWGYGLDKIINKNK